ncbi:hypothetical protein BDN70DRAFT_901473 [Pholiota conissans]|uniref:Uncharacterized protein n=1 Tax=Pholiota conissans TaxID=109636 RepID=A0A9P5YK24_9AGAR|nr:hypothetical protein BDN70DRAFT_901473 [Pholiota conissans]
MEIIPRLQHSLSAITGPATLSSPYHLDSSYLQCFVNWDEGSLEDCLFRPAFLPLSMDCKLIIYIESNPQIIEGCTFAVNIYRKYYKAVCSATGKRVTRAAIQATLHVGETWLSDALEGSRLAQIYGRSGSDEVAKVVVELEIMSARNLVTNDNYLGRECVRMTMLAWKRLVPSVGFRIHRRWKGDPVKARLHELGVFELGILVQNGVMLAHLTPRFGEVK